MGQYENMMIANGFDNLDFMVCGGKQGKILSGNFVKRESLLQGLPYLLNLQLHICPSHRLSLDSFLSHHNCALKSPYIPFDLGDLQ